MYNYQGENGETLTSVDDIVQVAIFQSTADLTGKLPRNAFPQPTVADYVVEHLASIDVFENHVVVMVVDNHLSHATDIRVVEEHGKCRFPEGPDLF